MSLWGRKQVEEKASPTRPGREGRTMSENHPSDDHDLELDRAPRGRDGHQPFHEPAGGPGPSPLRPAAPAPSARRLARSEQPAPPAFTYEQRLLILDIWRRSGLPAGDFA